MPSSPQNARAMAGPCAQPCAASASAHIQAGQARAAAHPAPADGRRPPRAALAAPPRRSPRLGDRPFRCAVTVDSHRDSALAEGAEMLRTVTALPTRLCPHGRGLFGRETGQPAARPLTAHHRPQEVNSGLTLSGLSFHKRFHLEEKLGSAEPRLDKN